MLEFFDEESDEENEPSHGDERKPNLKRAFFDKKTKAAQMRQIIDEQEHLMENEIHSDIYCKPLDKNQWKHSYKDIKKFARETFNKNKENGDNMLKYSMVDFQDMIISIKINRILSAENVE